MPKGTVSSEVPIFSLYTDCILSFRKLLQSANSGEHETFLGLLRKQFGRFQVWAENAGAHRRNRVSLDYRLREASKVKGMVIKLLEDLATDLQDAMDVISGKEDSDDDDSCSLSSSVQGATAETSEGEYPEGEESTAISATQPDYTELDECLEDVTDVITCLYKFSVTIRNPAPRDRLQKCSSIDVSHFEFYDVQHISNKFRDAPQYLQERLGKANVRRRQLLIYYRIHCDKIAGRYTKETDNECVQSTDAQQNVPHPSADSEVNDELDAMADMEASKEKKKDHGTLAPPATATIATRKTETTISIYVPRHDNFDIDAGSDTNQSRTSYSSSVGGVGLHPLRVPPLPESALDNSPFQCPICLTIIKVSGHRSWKKHVFQDLRPYVCTFQGCAKSDHLFDSQHEWFEHETEFHRRSWHCNRCNEVFSTAKGFEKHLQEHHSDSYGEQHLRTVVKRCERPTESDQQCLLCGEMYPFFRLQKHLGSHMQQTALFVLRPSETEEKGESVSGAAQGDSDEDSRELGESDLDFRSNPSQGSNGEDAGPPIPEGEGEKVADVTEAEPEATVRLRDATGREFSFPFELCRTWAGIGDLIKQEFLNDDDDIGPRVIEGHYELRGPDGVISPQAWESVIQPGLSVTMHMLPTPERPSHAPPPPPPEPKPASRTPTPPPLEPEPTPAQSSSSEPAEDTPHTQQPDGDGMIQLQDETNFESPPPAVPEPQAKDIQSEGSAPTAEDPTSYELLCSAAKAGDLKECETLLTSVADINVLDIEGRSPLHIAAMKGHKDVVKLLSERGDINLQNNSGRTPLSLASSNGHEDVVKFLLERNDVDVNSRSNKGETPLLWAAYKGCEGVVKALLERGEVDVNLQENSGKTPLWWAATGDHGGIVKLLLEHGADVNLQDDGGQTPLSFAAAKGFEDAVKFLLERGADVNSKDNGGPTPLLRAAAGGHGGVMKLLLEHGGDVNSRDNDGRTLLSWVAVYGHTDVATLLLDRGVDVDLRANNGRTPLSFAAGKGHGDTVKLLLEHGGDVNSQDNDGRTLLSWAAESGHIGIIKLLLEHLDVDPRANNGRTPLSFAAANGREDTVRLLLERGANVNSQDNDGWTPYSWATENGHIGIIKLMLEHLNVDLQANNGQTPLSFVAAKGHEDAVKFLLEHGADINSKDNDGRTLLSWAAESGHIGIIKLLLEHLDVDPRANNGRTALSFAAAKGHEDAVKLLLERGADVNSQDNDGRTLLSWAAEYGHTQVVKLLLERGVDVNSRANNGRTPLSWTASAQREHESVVQLLLDHGAVIYSEDSEQKSPLHYAVEQRNFGMFKLLLKVVDDPLVRNLLPLLSDFKDWDVENLLPDLVLAERRLGGDHKDTIKIAGEIADALYSKQSLKAARDWYRRVLEWQERELGKEHSETLQTSKRITELNDVIRE